MKQKFCLDTSVFINGWWKHYRIDVFPSFWKELDRLIQQGVVISCEEVYEELKRQKDELFRWAKKRKTVFEKPSEDTFHQLAELMNAYPNYAAASGTTNSADPWVIAHAKLARATVVTYEEAALKMRDTKPPKIPNICDDLGMRCLGVLDFLKEANVKF